MSRRPRRSLEHGRTVVLLLWALSFGLQPSARADDLADEADLQFEIGTGHYQAREFREALEHFLASNRLVPNTNVAFNVARSYEQLGRFAEAYRWYVQVLERETEETHRVEVEAALVRIAPNVAVVRVVTEPPGATIFVGRRDLGPRGSGPRMFAFEPGQYRFFAEMEGHEPSPIEEAELSTGRVTTVRLVLRRIVGTLRVEGAPLATEVRLDDDASPPVCRIPCSVPVAPGRYVLHLSHEGYRHATVVVSVVARRTVTVRQRLSPLTGTLVVDVGERRALIEVDGRAIGYSPAVIPIPIGQRRIRISKPGFRPLERTAALREDRPTRIDEALEELHEVAAASWSTEEIDDAPSSVTVLGPEELRALAYPTLFDALRGVRGVYVWDDRAYPGIGIRGLGRLGDYNNRLVVLLDGMRTNEEFVGSCYPWFEGRTDLEDVQRIEVVRGPGSLLYGTGAMSGVVNVVTEREGPSGGRLMVGVAPGGVARAHAHARARLGREAGVWLTAGGARSDGQDFQFPELADGTSDGTSVGLDGFEAAMLSGRAWAGDVELLFHGSHRRKDVGTGEWETLLGVPGTQVVDQVGLGEVRWQRPIGERASLFTRVLGGVSRSSGDYVYAPEDGGTGHEAYAADWTGAEARLSLAPLSGLRLTTGGEARLHLRGSMRGWADEGGEYLDTNDTRQTGAGYLWLDWTASRLLRFEAGVRVDAHSTFGTALSPRFAAILHPWRSSRLKLMGGRAFRAPSVFELDYGDEGLTQVPPKSLEPESIWSAEVELSQQLPGSFTLIGSLYGTAMDDLVVLSGAGDEEDPNLLVNSEQRIQALGAEVEIAHPFRRGLLLSASVSAQRSWYVGAGPLEDREVPNSPPILAAVKAVVPVVPRLFVGATRLSFEGPRWDVHDRADDPPQSSSGAAVIWDLALSGEAGRHDLTWSAGVTNALDWRQELPVSREFAQRALPQAGRSFFALLRWEP